MVEADSTGAEPTSTIKIKEELTDLEKRIIRQVEYYFGDINLGRDKFMQEQIKLDDGWIPMETMLKFNRLSQLSKEPSVITQALAKSTSQLMEISEDNTKIRRSPSKPLPEMNEDRRKELMKRTVYCKGFPVEGTTITKLLEFFPQFGEVDNVIMRSYNDKATKTWKFKGSAYVIFPTVESAQKFKDLESVKYEDNEIIRKFQSEYLEDKRKERLSRIAKKNKSKGEKKEGEDGKKEGEDGKEEVKEEGVEVKKEEGGEGSGGEDDEQEEKEDMEFPRDSVVHLKGLKDTEVSREDIKAAVEMLGIGVAFVDFSKGLEEAWLRLDSKGAAIEMASRLKEGKLEIKENVTVELRVVDGEEEEAFLSKSKDDKRKQQKRRNKGRRGGRGGFRGRKRRGSPQRGPNKMQKTGD